VDAGDEEQGVGTDQRGELLGCQVLVDNRFHPAEAAGRLAHDRDPATPAGNYDRPGRNQRPDCGGLDHFDRMG
jgi:hypothetical protein